MSLRRIALRYMTRFRCIGPECEDSCCQGWRVTVDQGHYARLKRKSAADPADRERFDRFVALLPPRERDRGHFAQIQFEEAAACPFLDRDRLCSIQRRHGEDLLPDTCALYPRFVNRVGGRLELTGALSCPEVARLALLAEDATELLEVPATLLGRGAEHNDMSTGALAGFARHLDEVRGTMYELVSRREFPLASRLHFVAFLAERTDPLFQSQPFDQPALEAAVDELGRPEVLAALHAAFAQAPPMLPLGLEVVTYVLAARLEAPEHPAFATLLREVFDSYAADPAAGVSRAAGADGDLTIAPALLSAAYAGRRDAAAAAFGDSLDRCCWNYCRHYWIKEWYVLTGSLRAHAISLLAQLAVQRFLLLSHPATAAAAATGDVAAFERLAVRVFYTFARSTGHNPLFAELVRDRLARRLQTVAEARCLLSV